MEPGEEEEDDDLGEGSGSAGISLRRARIRRTLAERAVLNPLLDFEDEKMFDDFERMRYTRACTITNIPTFINISPNPFSIIILNFSLRLENQNFYVCIYMGFLILLVGDEGKYL